MWIAIAAGVVVLIAIVVGALILNSNRGAPAAAGVEQQFPNEGQTHVPDTTQPTYNHYPPSSGPHYDAPAPWGTIGTTLPEGRFVHNLEHGGIAVLYKCSDDCVKIASDVTALYNNLPNDPRFGERKLVATPYTHMDHKFAAVAWTFVLEMDSWDPSAIERFYNAHVDRGPEQVP
jgi:hypothetical protein